MTELSDKMRAWCQEESLPITVEQDDEQALLCSVTLPGEPPLSVPVRVEGPLHHLGQRRVHGWVAG